MKIRNFVLLLCTALLPLAAFAAGPGYHVVNTWKLGGDGGWDYLTVDADAHRLH